MTILGLVVIAGAASFGVILTLKPKEIDECLSTPCTSNATCIDGLNSYSCRCLPGYNGINCEIEIDECISKPCINNATCVNGLNSYSCRCMPGYNGANCEIDINDCTNQTCMNNATCVDGLNSYSCSCLPGYNGINCENDIDDCNSTPCQNGATCNDRVDGYSCSCTIDWSGINCDQTITSHYGTDFYIGVHPFREKNYIIIDIASQQDGSAVLSVPNLNVHLNVNVKIGATTFKVNGTIIKGGKRFNEKRGIHIQTDVPVSLFVTMFQNLSYMETYLALPVTALGTSYKVASYDPASLYPSFYSVLGISANTNVTTHFNNQTTSFTLQPLSVGQHAREIDLTGAFIESNRLIAVISGSSVACIPRGIGLCYDIVEQMVPTRHWHDSFIVPPIFPKQGFVLKILTIYNETVCIKNTTNTIWIFSSIVPDGGILMGTDPVVVTSTAPISVVQYGVGYYYDRSNGGPFMTVIPDIRNYLNEYHFVVSSVYIDFNNYLSIIVSSSQAQGLYLDGASLGVIKQYNVPDPFSKYAVIIANITVGYHRLWHKDSNVMFGATVYGLGGVSGSKGYGFPVGFSFTIRLHDG